MGLWVVDLLAPDGISVNDALVRYALLADNDVLRVGRYQMRIRSRFASRDQSSHSAGDMRVFLSALERRGAILPARISLAMSL